MTLRLLVLCHNHPRLHPGGTEIFAHDLFLEMKRQSAVEGLFLACVNGLHRAPRPGVAFQAIGTAADEALVWTGGFDRLNMNRIGPDLAAAELSKLLAWLKPDVVHIHHTLLLGVEMLGLIRRRLPKARIVMTLHDYFLICARDGQMVKADGTLCRQADPYACRGCFPQVSPADFRLRETFLKTMLGVVDRFVAPSRFLRDRYAAWGLPAEKLAVIRNGAASFDPTPKRPRPDGKVRFGFFGNITPYKGVTVALEAARRLWAAGERRFCLQVHGTAARQAEAFQAELAEAARAAGAAAMLRGAYEREDLPTRLAEVDWVLVPSIWWENAPLVIGEAFRAGRPVIASGIGGMAEAVRDEVDGLHVPPGDPEALAAAMRRALDEPGLYDRLRGGIVPGPDMDTCARAYLDLFHDGWRQARPAALTG